MTGLLSGWGQRGVAAILVVGKLKMHQTNAVKIK